LGCTAYCIAGGTANRGGKIKIAGSAELNRDLVDNPSTPDTNGAKIWLVLEDDVDCDNETRIGWNPTAYLFENNGIFYDDTDV